MTKKRALLLFTFSIVLLLVFFKKEQLAPLAQKYVEKSPAFIPHAIEEREVINQKRQLIKRTPASAKFINTPSPEWKAKLHANLKLQAGSQIKEIKIEKERSLIWMRDQNPLLVESVKISLKNDQLAQSSFRALVDSQTGKVLETWDQTIFDPANVRDGFRIKLDSRYSN